jgi:uncharacterized SAM-dependent methyltransferase
MSLTAPSNPVSTAADNALVHEITSGLLQSAAAISPKFLYDPLGSHLFTAITLLPEYYPTNTERFIFERYKKEIADAVGSGGVFIDLGAGNCQKAESFFDVLKPNAYVAIDFSAEYLTTAVDGLKGKYPGIAMHAIAMDFTKALSIPSHIPAVNRTFFYPGSSIGNFIPSEAKHLLTQMKLQAGNGGRYGIRITVQNHGNGDHRNRIHQHGKHAPHHGVNRHKFPIFRVKHCLHHPGSRRHARVEKHSKHHQRGPPP